MTTYFLKDLISGKKKRIKGKHVMHITIPHYDGLFLDDIASYVQKHPEPMYYLPDGKEYKKLPKQWIANVCYTVLKEPFAEWVKAQVH